LVLGPAITACCGTVTGVDADPPGFGEQLRELRRARRLSLRALAATSHYSKSLLSNWETGRSVPTVEISARLDRLLDANGRLAAAAAVAVPACGPASFGHFVDQGSVGEEIRRRLSSAAQLDVLAVRGLGLLGLNDSLLRPSMAGRAAVPLRTRVLLLDPDCAAASHRADEIGESSASFASGIKLTLARLEELAAAADGLSVEVRLYDRLPIWRIIRVDDTLWVSTFHADWEGHESTIYEVPESPRGALWAGYRRTYEDLVEHARRVI